MATARLSPPCSIPCNTYSTSLARCKYSYGGLTPLVGKQLRCKVLIKARRDVGCCRKDAGLHGLALAALPASHELKSPEDPPSAERCSACREPEGCDRVSIASWRGLRRLMVHEEVGRGVLTCPRHLLPRAPGALLCFYAGRADQAPMPQRASRVLYECLGKDWALCACL